MSTTIAVGCGGDARLDRMAAQLDELTAELRRRRRQREMLTELLDDATHLTGPALASLTARLQAAEERGYLDVARGGLDVLDRIVANFDEDDVAALGDNIVLILETVREMTQPEVMTMLRRTVHLVNEPGPVPTEPPSLLALLREMRDPDVRLGLARLLGVLRTLATDTAPTPRTPAPKEG